MALLLALLLAPAWSAGHDTLPRNAHVLVADDAAPPAELDPRWQAVTLPDTRPARVAWYRVEFDKPAGIDDTDWMLYLPYFYGGGRIWLNGTPVASVPESTPQRRVRWERPMLLPLPGTALRDGRNVLLLRSAASQAPNGAGVPRLVVGTQDALQPPFERRFFFVRTVPLVTVIGGSILGLFVIFIWLRRRQEVLYGLFGLAALLWAVRTTTFVFDTLPTEAWPAWRMLYFATTGGFIIAMALFALALAGWYHRRIAIALGAYGVLGPVLYALTGERAEFVVGGWWVAGLIPVGLSIAVVSIAAALRQRTVSTIVIAVAVVLAFLTGVHDYLVAWRSPLLQALAPSWAEHRFFLLHHGANGLLLVMGALLTARFLRSLAEAEESNRTLEARVAAREQEIAQSYARIAALQREQAATDERQRIMQDLHDGLGSQLFTSLSRAERGALDQAAMADTLRRSIDEMRLAIEALASDEGDFRTAFGNFRFRWDARLREAGLQTHWTLDVPDTLLAVPPHDALQLLRILQEALTNVLKHAQAREVHVTLRMDAGRLTIEVADDGRGFEAADARGAGRGLANMRSRATRLRGDFALDSGGSHPRGTRVRLSLPVHGPRDGPAAPAPPLLQTPT